MDSNQIFGIGEWAQLLIGGMLTLFLATRMGMLPMKKSARLHSSSPVDGLDINPQAEDLANEGPYRFVPNCSVTTLRGKHGIIVSQEADDSYMVQFEGGGEPVRRKAKELCVPKVEQIIIYPIKSCAGINLQDVQISRK